jgi:ribosomal protein L11 methyltransferase
VAEKSAQIHWIEVKIITNGELAEALAEVLGRFVSNGVVVESVTQFNPHTQESEPTGDIAVFGYLAADEDWETKRQKLTEALWHMRQIADFPEPVYTPIHDQDWMAAWKQHYTPIPVGETLLIIPAWHQPAASEPRTVVRINPAMAFGTGTHPTTQLILALLEKHFHPGFPLIDVGCGSGILSIAALKMGATHALAVDVDQQAVQSTLENAALNGIPGEQLETGKGSVEEILTGRFTLKSAPLVLVNILAPIILRLFDDGLANLVEDEGLLLLSGLLDHQETEVVAKAEAAGFTIIDRRTDGDWVSLAAKKRPQ